MYILCIYWPSTVRTQSSCHDKTVRVWWLAIFNYYYYYFILVKSWKHFWGKTEQENRWTYFSDLLLNWNMDWNSQRFFSFSSFFFRPTSTLVLVLCPYQVDLRRPSCEGKCVCGHMVVQNDLHECPGTGQRSNVRLRRNDSAIVVAIIFMCDSTKQLRGFVRHPDR